MGATGFVAYTAVRRRWARVVALSVLVAVAGGVVTAAVLGSERSRTSLERFIADTNAADAGVFVQDQDEFDALVDVPGVAMMSRFSLLAFVPSLVVERDDVFLPMLGSHDGRFPYEMNRYRVMSGRMPEPDSIDEIALHEATAQLLGVEVGDDIDLLGYTPDDVELILGDEDGAASPSGPTVTMEVAAVVRDPLDVVVRADDIVVTPLTAAFTERYRREVGSIGEGAFFVLDPGTDVEAFTETVRRRLPDAEVEVWIGGTPVAATGFGPTLDVIGDGLDVLALVVAVAGVILIGQALFRTAVTARDEVDTLGVLGLDRRSRILALAVPGVVVALVGSLGTVILAWALSARFPVGIARRAEPSPGAEWDFGIVVGAAATFLMVTGLSSASARLATRAGRRPAGPPRLTASRFGPVTRVVASGSAVLGRSTRAAVAIGGMAVAAALVFASSMDHLLDSPRLYGWGFDAAVVAETSNPTLLRDGVDVAADPAVADVALAIFQIRVDVDGSPAFAYAIGDGTGTIEPTVAKGRPPRLDDEVAVGRETMHRIGVSVGDEVVIDAGNGPTAFGVVGQAVIPVSADGGRVGSGVAMTTHGAGRLGLDLDDPCSTDDSCYRQVVVRWADGADLVSASDRMLAAGSADFPTPEPPAEVARLREVEGMPWVVAGLLTLLAGAATVHAIVITVHRRRRDLAVLRALGVTSRQARRAVTTHVALLVAGAGILGAVLGVAIGRWVWHEVAGSIGVAAVPVIPVLVLVLLPLAVVVLAEAAALIPARSAARVRPAETLRTE